MIRTLFVSVFALFAIGCAGVDSGDVGTTEQAVSDSACHYRCQKCPPNQVCTQLCYLSGNCTSDCTVIAMCIIGYHWDTTACRCLPDGGNGEPTACGAGFCAPGDVCCNSSCGICTAPGGVCIQIACEPAL